ncbi:MAG: flagellar biosynthesis protein FlhB [Solirubrobacterales bacterium]|nr:flagellar biosynthesis protein FlhB [Solirubrobacterales bacterium]
MAGEKTEKATPKKREEARKKGQVARSQDLTGASVMLVGIFVLGVTGAGMAGRMAESLRGTLQAISDPDVVTHGGVGTLMLQAGTTVGLAVAPVALACALTAILVTGIQVGPKPRPGALRPDPKRMNPISGAKNLFGPNALFETGKNLVKIGVVAAVTLAALLPHLPEMASLVGMTPADLAARLASDIKGIALRAAVAYFLIGVVDLFYQRWRHEKSLRMDHQEIKEEQKQYALPAEVRGAMRRRQMANARARMMAAVPEADVVVTNPTHYSVALKYDGSSSAPEVVAKGKDIIALRIREIAREHGVPIVPDPPLARSLHATVEVGEQIPEELFQAVAQVLAYVYRVAGRRRLASA